MKSTRRLNWLLSAVCSAIFIACLYAAGCSGRSADSRSVTYKVWSTPVAANAAKTDASRTEATKADIVYIDDNGSNDLPDTSLPWTTTVYMEKFPTASVRAGTGEGTVQMSITVDGKVVCQQSSASGKACEFALRPS